MGNIYNLVGNIDNIDNFQSVQYYNASLIFQKALELLSHYHSIFNIPFTF